jgi:hypothetical protein
MANVSIDSYSISAKISGNWVDITEDVAPGIKVFWGIVGTGPTNTIADPGTLDFDMINTTGKYSPGLAGAMAGWGMGIPVRLIITYEGIDYLRFYGTIKSIDLVSAPGIGNFHASVHCMDWMNEAIEEPITSASIQFGKRADEALTTIVSTMAKMPMNTNFGVGDNTFITVFDTVQTKTRAYEEMAKLVKSEMGYLYLRKDRIYGETLVFEPSSARTGILTINQIPLNNALSGRLETETAVYLLQENGSKIIVSQTQDALISDATTDLVVDYGKDLLNYFTITAFPKKVDTSPVTLFSLTSPIRISSIETIVFRSNYIDPTGSGATVNGFNMSAITGSDYLMNSKSDGTGTDLTAYLHVQSVVYGTEGVTYTLINLSINTAYITKLQAIGYGIYSYAQLDTSIQDENSIYAYGYQQDSIEQPYNQNLTNSVLRGNAFVALYASPQTIVKRISFIANRSDTLLSSFLNLDIGNIIHLVQTPMGIDELDFIQAIELEIIARGVIAINYYLKKLFSVTSGLSLMSAEFPAGNNAMINYGNIPGTTNLKTLSLTAWVYITSYNANFQAVGGIYSDFGADYMYLANGYIFFISKNSIQQGVWHGNTGIPLNAWTLIVVIRDTTVSDLDPPIFYYNNTSMGRTTDLTPSGNRNDETGVAFTVGNLKTPAYDYSWPFAYGKLKDVRMYNRTITGTDLHDLYYGTSPVTDGLIFQGPCVKTQDATILDGTTLTAEQKVLDNIRQMVGNPAGVIAHIP